MLAVPMLKFVLNSYSGFPLNLENLEKPQYPGKILEFCD